MIKLIDEEKKYSVSGGLLSIIFDISNELKKKENRDELKLYFLLGRLEMKLYLDNRDLIEEIEDGIK